jgi:3-methyladenine DNA glycosylase AlkD
MAAYMKDIAPFLGIGAPERRGALRAAWRDAPLPTSAELGEAAMLLMKEREREFHYAAYDIIDWNVRRGDDYFLDTYVTDLLTTKPWWDTVDGLVNAAVSPLCRRFDAAWLIDEWSESGDIWLVRAAIGHQRGWKRDTDVPRVLQLCERHWSNSEFFVAKAIGWALRDLVRIDSDAVRRFLASRRIPNSVAEREARRGLDRLT